jgi:hypothetical protein
MWWRLVKLPKDSGSLSKASTQTAGCVGGWLNYQKNLAASPKLSKASGNDPSADRCVGGWLNYQSTPAVTSFLHLLTPRPLTTAEDKILLAIVSRLSIEGL